MKGYKTLLFSLILAIAGALEQFDWLEIVPEQWNGLVLVVIGLIVAWLRKITTTPVGKSE
jgi:hypothetical protein